MSNTHTFTQDHANLLPKTGVYATVYQHEATKYDFKTESESLSVFLDEGEVPISDLMETANKYRTQGPGAFKTHEQLKRELFGD